MGSSPEAINFGSAQKHEAVAGAVIIAIVRPCSFVVTNGFQLNNKKINLFYFIDFISFFSFFSLLFFIQVK
jgi:hypothetical protein